MNTLETALLWLDIGIPPIPVFSRTKRAMVKWQNYQKKLPSEQDVRAWFNHGSRNLAIICGWQNLAILDVESWGVYLMLRDLAPWPETFEVRTGRGAHVYFFTEQPEPKAKFSWQAEIRSEKSQYCLTAPSIHPSGAAYSVLVNAPIATIQSIRSILPAALLADEEPMLSKRQCFPNTPPAADNGILAKQTLAVPPIPGDGMPTAAMWAKVNNADRPVTERIKAAYRIEAFFQDAQKTTADGRWLIVRCPFHDDGNPSFWIDTQAQRCGCYAGCTAKSYDVIDLYARLNKISISDAIRAMAETL